MRNTKEYPITADKCIDALAEGRAAISKKWGPQPPVGNIDLLALMYVHAFLNDNKDRFESYLRSHQ